MEMNDQELIEAQPGTLPPVKRNYNSRSGLQAHHWRHIISGTIVFLAGIAVNMAHVYLVRHEPVSVQWLGSELQHGYKRPSTIPTNFTVQVGICADGSLTWRQIQPTKP
jgi:hypothetical protein